MLPRTSTYLPHKTTAFLEEPGTQMILLIHRRRLEREKEYCSQISGCVNGIENTGLVSWTVAHSSSDED